MDNKLKTLPDKQAALKKLTGNIQTVYRTPEKEKNYVTPFKGRIDLMRKLWRIYKTGCSKFYVFFDSKKINNG